MQQYTGVYLLQNYSTCFGCPSYPSSGIHQTVTAASGTGNNVTATTLRQRGLISCFFYIHGSVHRNAILIRSNKLQQNAGVYLLQNYSTCFGCLLHPSSGAHQTVTAASGTGHITCRSNNLPPAWPN